MRSSADRCGDTTTTGEGESRASPGKATRSGRIQRKAADGGDPAAGADRAAALASGGGEALPDGVRGRFESSLGADLGAVRLHTGADSAAAAGAVSAQAFAVGSDIHFGAGRYQPDDPFGMHLLAHEVAHTQQQAGGAATAQHKLDVSQPGDALEHDADRAADAMVKGQPATVATGAVGVIARKPTTPAATYKKATHVGTNHDKTIDWNDPPQLYGLAGDQAKPLREQYKVHLRSHLMSEKEIVELGVGYEPEAIVQRLDEAVKAAADKAAAAKADAAAAATDAATGAVDDALGGASDLVGGLFAGDSGKVGDTLSTPKPKKKAKDASGGPDVDVEACRKALWRSAQRAIADTLSTETSDARYKKKGGTTYCNVYGTDMVNAMGGYLPRVWYADLGIKQKMTQEELKKNNVPVVELSANLIGDWLAKWGADFGWTRMNDAKKAQEEANAGRVAIIQASKIDGVSAGHVGVIMAAGNGHEHTTGTGAKGEETYQPLQSQAGASNFKYSDAPPAGGGIGDSWWKGAGMKDESVAGNFYIYKGGHMSNTAVASSKELGKAD